MADNKYISDIQYIDHNIETVYNYLADFGNLSRYLTDDILAQLGNKLPQLSINNFESDSDSCRFEVGAFGKAEIRIVEREPHKTIKVQGQGGLPVALTFWIQLLPLEEARTKLRLTLHAEMSMMVRMMIGSKLEEGINQLARTLAGLPYS